MRARVRVHACVYDSCRVQGFRSLLAAITVARRGGIIALIVPHTRQRTSDTLVLGHGLDT